MSDGFRLASREPGLPDPRFQPLAEPAYLFQILIRVAYFELPVQEPAIIGARSRQDGIFSEPVIASAGSGPDLLVGPDAIEGVSCILSVDDPVIEGQVLQFVRIVLGLQTRAEMEYQGKEEKGLSHVR